MPVLDQASLTGDRLLELDRLFNIRHDFEVIIVNNNSSDRTRELLKWWKDNSTWRMLVKHCTKNIGFGPGHNLGAKSARGRFLFLLSNDVVIQGDFMDPIIQFLEKEETNFICSPRVVDWKAGWNEFEPDTVIPYAEGFLLGMTLYTWKKLGGFDPKLAPCDYEDVDLSYKAAKEGVQLHQIAVPVEHIGGATAGYDASRRLITEKHRKYFAAKWSLQWSPVR